jgi:cell division protease FtsH
VLEDHIDELHRFSGILIERETIDKDQFERLLAGEDEATVFPEEPVAPEDPVDADEKSRKPQPAKPRPFPLPGATFQGPPPADAKG